MPVYKPMPKHNCGSPRMPSEVGADDPNYTPGEINTRPMTDEEKLLYGVAEAVTPDKIRALIAQGIRHPRQIAAVLNSSTKAISVIMTRNGIPKYAPSEEEVMKLSKPTLTIDKVEELMKQGRTPEDIGKEYFPHKPGIVNSIIIKNRPELLEKYKSNITENNGSQNDSKKKLSKDEFRKLIDQGRQKGKDDNAILAEIGQKYFSKRPANAFATAARLGLIEKKADKIMQKAASKASEEVFRLAAMVEELAKRVVALEEYLKYPIPAETVKAADNNASTGEGQNDTPDCFKVILELGEQLAANRKNVNFQIERDLTKWDNRLLTALEQIVSWLNDGCLEELYDTNKFLNQRLDEITKKFKRHRHQIAVAHYSEVPDNA